MTIYGRPWSGFVTMIPAGMRYYGLAGSLWRFWEVRGYIDEGRSWMSLCPKEKC